MKYIIYLFVLIFFLLPSQFVSACPNGAICTPQNYDECNSKRERRIERLKRSHNTVTGTCSTSTSEYGSKILKVDITVINNSDGEVSNYSTHYDDTYCSCAPCKHPLVSKNDSCECPDGHSNGTLGDLGGLSGGVPSGVTQLEVTPDSEGQPSSYCTSCNSYSSPLGHGSGCDALKNDIGDGLYNSDRCESGKSVGQNDFSVQSSQGTNAGCFGFCTVNCTGSAPIQTSCGESPSVVHESCSYTGGICMKDDFSPMAQPAPEDCKEHGPWGIGWTKSVSETSRVRPCICDHFDLFLEFVDRCGYEMAAGAAAGFGFGNSGSTNDGFSRMPKPSPLPSPASILTSAGGAALAVFASNCLDDPVNPSATNVTNCPWKRIGKDCIMPPDALNPMRGDPLQNNCPPGTYYPFPGADYCVEENQWGMPRDRHDDYTSDYSDNHKTPNCPEGTYAYDGLCWCDGTDKLYTQQFGCEQDNPEAPEEPQKNDDPDNSGDDNQQDSETPPDDIYNVWVDNFHEVTDVLDAMKDRQCGWDEDNPCYVHVNNDVLTVTVDNFDDIEKYFRPLDDIKKDTGEIRRHISDVSSELTGIRQDTKKLIEQGKEQEELLTDIKENLGCDKSDTQESLCNLLNKIKDSLICTDKAPQDGVCDVIADNNKDDQPQEQYNLELPQRHIPVAGQCPSLAIVLTHVVPGSYAIPTEYICKMLEIIGLMVLASAYWRAARIYMQGVLYS